MIEELKTIPKGKAVFIASDFHLDPTNRETGAARETKSVRWLNEINNEAHAVILVGDTFDFWFEYKQVVPKGLIRFFGKLAELADAGVQILIFTGNHDLWIQDYLRAELGAQVIRKPECFQIGNKKLLIGHGDGVGPGDKKFKLIKKIFTSKLNQRLFSWIHPDLAFYVARKWSHLSKKKSIKYPDPYLGKQEPIFLYCQKLETLTHHDYYVFGHRHIHYQMPINDSASYINLGDWWRDGAYLRLDNDSLEIKTFEK